MAWRREIETLPFLRVILSLVLEVMRKKAFVTKTRNCTSANNLRQTTLTKSACSVMHEIDVCFDTESNRSFVVVIKIVCALF